MIKMEEIDVNQYYEAIEPHVKPIGSIFTMVFKKQKKDLGIGDTAKPKDIDALIERVSKAIEFFSGSNTRDTVRRIMRKELRRMAPTYFKEKYGF